MNITFKNYSPILISFSILMALSLSLTAQTVTEWIAGSDNSNWHLNDNWDNGIPDNNKVAKINDADAAVVISIPASAVSVEVRSGKLEILPTSSLTINGSIAMTQSSGILIRDNGEVINDGMINISDTSSDGINCSGKFTNNGEVDITDASFASIQPSGVNNMFINNGSITINSPGTTGLQISFAGSMVNYGLITILNSSRGVRLWDNNTKLDNYGNINIKGASEIGLLTNPGTGVAPIFINHPCATFSSVTKFDINGGSIYTNNGFVNYLATIAAEIDASMTYSDNGYQYDPSDHLPDNNTTILPSPKFTTLTVLSTADMGAGSLREMVGCAASGDTITFDHVEMGAGNIGLNSSIILDKNLVFLGIDSAATIIDGAAGDFSLFDIQGETDIEIRDMSFINGGGTTLENDGGAINTFDNGSENPKSLKIIACGFRNNKAGNTYFGGAIMSHFTNTTIANSYFSGNGVAVSCGGAILHGANDSGYMLDIVNSVFTNNKARFCGGAINISRDQGQITNCTFVTNKQTEVLNSSGGGAIRIGEDATLTINNSILTNNTAAFNGGPNIKQSGNITANNNLLDDYDDSDITAGTVGNIEGGPLFVDEAAGDYTLQACSPAVDAGDQTLLPLDDLDVDGNGTTAEVLPIDFADNSRVQGANVDMGAYEYSKTQSCTYAEVVCGTQTMETYCYVNNDDTGWLYHASNGSSNLRLEFTAGTIESGWDEIRIYNGQDVTAPILFDGDFGGDLSGLTIVTTQPYLYFEVDSDFSDSCGDEDLTQWDWTVDCFDCTPGAGNAEVASVDCDKNEFMVDVNITNLGDGSIVIANDADEETITVTTTGIHTIGPFPFGNVTITLEHPVNPLCNLVLPVVINNLCNDKCAGAIPLDINPIGTCPANQVMGTTIGATDDGFTSCDGVGYNNGVWFSFMTASNQTSILYQNISISGSHEIAIFEGCDGNEVYCSGSDENSVSGLTGDTEYRVLIWSDGIGSAGDFNICLSEEPPLPSNDLCIDAIPLDINPYGTCPTHQISGTTNGALPDQLTNYCTYDEAGVWYTFTTGANQTSVIISIDDLDNGTAFLVLDGCDGVLFDCQNSNINHTLNNLTESTQYYILVFYSNVSGLIGGDFNICLSAPPPPSNDLCADAIPLVINPNGTCPTNQISGTTIGALPDQLTDFCTNDAVGVWYTFTTGANQTSVNIPIEELNNTTAFVVLDGCDGVLLDCDFSHIDYTLNNLTESTQYYILVFSSVSNVALGGDFNICLSDPDSCPEYQDLTGDFTGTGIYSSAYNSNDTNGGKIISDQTIKANADLGYSAGMEVILSPGFEVEASALFHAYIDGCQLPLFQPSEDAPSEKK